MNNRAKLIQASLPFLEEVKNLTPGKDLEQRLNATYGARSLLFQELSGLAKLGVEEGWAADEEVAGPNYRRSRIIAPTPETSYFSVTAVYMNSADAKAFEHPEEGRILRGQFHSHPYGELNLVAPIDPGAELRGLNGWQGAGWTAPHPGSRHFPEARGGALIALVYLPAGRISYDVNSIPTDAAFAIA
jgi:hypothetical protein